MSLSHRHRAFTLVELLVVISIIALLISLLLPALKNAREVARNTVCQSNMRQIGVALINYATEYDEYGPSIIEPRGAGNPDWPMQAAEYLGAPAGLPNATAVGDATGVLQCPSTYQLNAKRSYGMNLFFGNKNSSGQWKWDASAHPMPLSHPLVIDNPSEFVMAGESIGYHWLMPSWGSGSAAGGVRTLFPRLHQMRRNYLLEDGHVETTKPNGKAFLLGKGSGALGIDVVWGRNNHGGKGEWPVPPWYE